MRPAKRKQVCLSFDPDLLAIIDRRRLSAGTSRSAVVEEFVWAALAATPRSERKRPKKELD